jgi:hypothetical protein
VRRQATFFLYLAVVITLTGSIAYFGWLRTWTSVFVPAMYPAFADMRLIQGAVISVEHGLNPQVSNPGDQWGRPFDLSNAVGRNRESAEFNRRGVLYLDLHCGGVFLRRSLHLIDTSLPVVRPTCIAGLDGDAFWHRAGNTDLVIFCLLLPVALWVPKLWSPIPVLLGTALKLYPVFALGALLIQREFRLFAASLVGTVAIFGAN